MDELDEVVDELMVWFDMNRLWVETFLIPWQTIDSTDDRDIVRVIFSHPTRTTPSTCVTVYAGSCPFPAPWYYYPGKTAYLLVTDDDNCMSWSLKRLMVYVYFHLLTPFL
jgi:hypothetical protein